VRYFFLLPLYFNLLNNAMMNTINNKMTTLSRIFIFISSILLLISIFVPLWRIDLDAPQYPEGLNLLIYSYKLGGNVDIINGLNHYIGMKTLHAEDFIEFTVLPYIIGFFALFALLTSIISNKKILYILLTAFALFGILAMIDFWRWEYNYGHNLDPNAAIIVPGMAYQPPLIGFKQLLNFGAYSIPSYGGWLFIISGILMLVATLIETKVFQKFRKNKSTAAALLFILSLSLYSCNTTDAEPIKLNVDHCDYCKMSIADGRFGAEVITKKGRIYKFDDISCMHDYIMENKTTPFSAFYIHDYLNNNVLIPAESAFYVKDDSFKSPMGGNTAAFSNKTKADEIAVKLSTVSFDWKTLNL
jgi:copper chaperone NosL